MPITEQLLYQTNKSSNRSVPQKKLSLFVKISEYSQETPLMKSLLNKVLGRKARKFIKMRPQHRCLPVNIAKILMLSCEYCKIFKDTYFEEHLRTAASELK